MLIKENTKGQARSISQQALNLPEGFTIGEAIGGGDCFFDAVAQGLKQLKPEMSFTVESLREFCGERACVQQETRRIIEDARCCVSKEEDKPRSGVSDDELWEAYLFCVVYTAQDMEEIKSKDPGLYKKLTDSKYGKTLKVPVWGRPEIEGRMICSQYDVKLHVIENLPVRGWSDQLVDGLASRSIDYVDFSEENTIHIINKGGGHFEPILRKTVQQILPHCYDTMVSEKKSDSKSVYFQQVSENEMTDNQMDWEISSTNVEVSHAESTIVDYENRLSSEELQYKQSQGNPIRSRVESSSSTSKDISDSVWYSALTDCRSTVDDVGLTDDEITKKATLFVKTFVKEFEKKLSEYSKEAKPGSKVRKTGKVVDKVASVVSNYIPPSVEKVGASQVMECVGFISANQHRKKAKIFSTMALSSEGNLRKVLVEAGLEIFQSFEEQFTKIVDTNQLSWNRGIEKLAMDAVSRVINYTTSCNEKGEFPNLQITKGVILGKSKRKYPFTTRTGHQVKDKQSGEILMTSELYEKVGIEKAEGEIIKYYQLQEHDFAEKYGYRLPFTWELENWEELEQKYVLSETSKKREYVRILDEEKKKGLASSILKKINEEGFAQKKDIEGVKEYVKRQNEDMRQFSFNFYKLPKVFITREKVVKELNIRLHSKGQEIKMSRVVVIIGKSGIGKSELARGYGLSERRNNVWDKIMWIDASSNINLSDSFFELAKRLEISTEDKSGKKRRIESVVKDIYEHYLDTKSFFVFDNASGYKEIRKFLPSHFSDMFFNREKPFILITSCKEGWEEEEIEEIKLSNFDPKEFDEFFKGALRKDESQDDISKLGKMFNYHPLNLAGVAAGINQRGTSISEYLKQCYKKIQEISLDYLVELGISKELFLTVKSNLKKVKEEKDVGQRSYNILSSITYLDPNRIDVEEVFRHKGSEDKQEVLYATNLLEKFSLIEIDKSIVKIHEETQKVIRAELRKKGEEKEILRKTMTLLVNNSVKRESHIISVWDYITEYKELVNEFIDLTYCNDITILHLLAKNGNEEVIRLTLEKIDQNKLSKVINAVDETGFTPLHYAIGSDHLGVVKRLIEKGADLTKNEYAIHYAAAHNALEVMEYLIDEGYFTLDELDEHGELPLGYAIKYNQLRIVKYLVGKGADVNLLEDKEKMHLFYYAFIPGNLDIVKCLVENLRNVNLCDKDDMTPLHYAVTSNDLYIVEYLVKNGANVDLRDNNDMTPLHYAVTSDDLDIVKCLIENDANIDLYDGSYMSPLHYTAKNGLLAIVEYLVERRANINLQGLDNMGPLHFAVENDRLGIIEYFIEKKANIDLKDVKGRSPLHYAVKNGCLETIRCLIKEKANVNLQDTKGRSPLHYAVKNDHLGVARYLLEVGANINLIDKDGRNPLSLTTFNSTMIIFLYPFWQKINHDMYFLNLYNIQCLVGVVINVDQYDEYGKGLLHYAARDGCLDVVICLEKKGADVNLRDNDGMSPLHYATGNKHLDIVKYLIGKKVSVSLYDKHDMTPLHYAATDGDLTIVEYLVEKGADVNSYGKDGNAMSPLHCATIEGNLDIVKHLVEKGADVKFYDKYHKKPLDYAIESGYLHVAKYLEMQEGNVGLVHKQSQVSIKKMPKKRKFEDISATFKKNAQNVQLIQGSQSTLDEEVNSQLKNSSSQQLINDRYLCVQ